MFKIDRNHVCLLKYNYVVERLALRLIYRIGESGLRKYYLMLNNAIHISFLLCSWPAKWYHTLCSLEYTIVCLTLAVFGGMILVFHKVCPHLLFLEYGLAPIDGGIEMVFEIRCFQIPFDQTGYHFPYILYKNW